LKHLARDLINLARDLKYLACDLINLASALINLAFKSKTLKKTLISMKKRTTKKIELPRVAALVRVWAKYKRTSLSKMSLKMGKNRNYLQQQLSSNDIRPTMLLELSEVLSRNLFEHYTVLLPEHLQTTEREKLLNKKIESLETELEKTNAELEKVKAERDKYWDKIGG
jgi:hypothetical protein